jgi:2-dehydro-3-deoxygluconokinase
VTFGGAEANVAVAVAQQGGTAAFATVLPDNPLTDAFVAELRRMNVDDRLVQRVKFGRFGAYFVETGANQRSGTVTYDRDGSSIALAPMNTFDWSRILDAATWFHVTGITPAVSESAAAAAIAGATAARERGIRVSCDLNFRKKLWRWKPGVAATELAREVMPRLVSLCDLVIANEEDLETALGLRAGGSDVESGRLDVAAYGRVAAQLTEQYRGVQQVAVTLRESLSASHNNWGAMLLDRASGKAHLAPLDADGTYRPYEIRSIVDRVGAGDSFAGSLVFALQTPELAAPQTALNYAVAASCLKHSVFGDFCHVSRSEIEALMKGSGSGRVQR